MTKRHVFITSQISSSSFFHLIDQLGIGVKGCSEDSLYASLVCGVRGCSCSFYRYEIVAAKFG
jgi:hypothetical protein